MPDPIHRIVTATLIIGVPGGGKTSLLATFAEFLWEARNKKILNLYSWDGGAIPTLVQKRVKQGLIRFWRARTRSAEGLGIETLYQATKGYWPQTINPTTGETSPGVKLIPPVTGAYYVRCRQGHLLATLPVRTQLMPTYCDACKTLIPLSEQQVEEHVRQSEGFERVGGVAFDGLTSMTGEVLSFLDHERGEGRIGGEKASHGAPIVSGDIRIGGNNRADVGLGQTRAKEFINNSLSIPNLVEGPVFTALTMEASDEGGLSIVGPKLPGRAATDEAPAWVGNCFEMGKTLTDGQEQFTLFLRPFVDQQGRRHLLKTSASPTGLPDKLVDPVGQPWTQANLGKVFTMLDEDLKKALAEDDIPDAPGLAGTPTSFGGKGFSVTPTPPQTPASGIAPLAAAPTASATPLPGVTPLPAGVVPPPAATTTTAMPIAAPMAIPRAKKATAAPPPPSVPPGNGDGVGASPIVATPPPAPPGMKPPQRAPGTAAPGTTPSTEPPSITSTVKE